jgi:hypothetical protein
MCKSEVNKSSPNNNNNDTHPWIKKEVKLFMK